MLDNDSAAPAPATDRPAPFRATSAAGKDNALLHTSARYFEAEMAQLAETSWQFVATSDELSKPGDWVRAHVFGVDVFIQNFQGTLRAYRNVCQHRGFPIRREREGNGPVVCGFHAWRYDEAGVPIGVARNDELFCLSKEERSQMALQPVRIESVGTMVFAAVTDQPPPLEQFLGRYADLMRLVTSRAGPMRHRGSAQTRANWKLAYEVTLDDYHVPFVHPNSLGQKVFPAWGYVYEREAVHSHLLRRRTEDWSFASFWDDVGRGVYEFAGYKIHHVFPNMFLVVARGIILITLMAPRAFDRTDVEDRIFEITGDPQADDWWAETTRMHLQVSGEDRAVSEAQQEAIAGLMRSPTFGALEQRVAWFYEAYEQVVGSGARRRMSS